MRQRVITAVIALILFIPTILIGGILLDIVAIVLGCIAMSEILMMRKKLLISFEAILSMLGVAVLVAPDAWFSALPDHLTKTFIVFLLVMLLLVNTVLTRNRFSFDDAGVLTLGMLYIGMGFNYFVAARQVGVWMLFYVLFTIWSTDSGAYMIGRKIGKNKLAPMISPNKTWEGSIGGSIAAVIIGSVFAILMHVGYHSAIVMIVLTLIFSIAGQFGDLIESALKRYYGVKDSGKILPGHGGILDRFDSLLFVLPIVHLFGLI